MTGVPRLRKPMLPSQFTTEFDVLCLNNTCSVVSRIQKPLAFGSIMRSRLGFAFVLFLLLLTPLSALFTPQDGEQQSIMEETFKEVDFSGMSESERLAFASSQWHSMPSAGMVEVELAPASGMIHLAAGSFDPIQSLGPETTNSYSRVNDAMSSGMAIVQLHQNDGVVFDSIVKEYNLMPLDFLYDEAWLVRLPNPPMSTFDLLSDDDRVRWVGHQQPGWRVSPQLMSQSVDSYTLIPTPDLEIGGYADLATDLVRYGAKEAWCDAWLCQTMNPSSESGALLENLAHDGRVMWTEATVQLRVHNALAYSIAGVQSVNNNASFTLDGTGEMIAVADTGLDNNHPDLFGRVAATYTQYGLDPSPADSNSGHGTHIAISVLGNGSGDASARGVAPGSTLVMYALEHDPTGVFGRIGSIYDMLRDAEQMTARISVNAWGLNGNYGQYTADARSVDLFVHDRLALTPVFSVGDRGGQGASQVTSPATAKNVLGVGASTTGAGGSPAEGAVANFSAQGPSLDGRIKPDVVAPGVGICSGLAEEAKFPAGPSCASGTHASGNSYYMSLSGTSQATAIASGVTALTREFIREQVGLSSPSSSLVKAAVINGATDLGTPDIPNADEGWGQVNLERTVMPTDGGIALDTFFDDNTPLEPGFGLLYSFSMDPSHGVDITLAWTDEAGSANAPQSQARLVNNLDLILIDPSGNEWLGNQFASGASTLGGVADDVNNVERIHIPAGSMTATTGDWILKVVHRGGSTQDFGLVMAAVATPNPRADLTVFDGSILTSSASPLKDDVISIRLAWVNQGTKTSEGFDIVLEDLTTQQVLATATRPAISPGQIDSYIIYHQFSQTGVHQLKLSIDVNNQVVEMNDAVSGTDNNILELDVEVKALGLRVVVSDGAGTFPETAEAREAAANMNLDVRNDSGIDIPLGILHEGTGNQSVTLSSTMVQIPSPDRPDFLLPSQDTWTRTFDAATKFELTAQGTSSANKSINLRLEDIDADLTTDPDSPRYVRAGTYVVDVTARYEFTPTVEHTQRITVVVNQLDQVSVVAAGTSGLTAEPGDSSFFSISVKNTGNAPAQYSVECFSSQRWQLMLGGSNSSQLDFEPLNIQEYLPMAVRIIVPPVANGVPEAGDVDEVTCYVTSSTDPSMNFTEIVSITVLAQESFDVHLEDDIGRVGPSALASDYSVDSGEQFHMNLSVENTGNIAIQLDVRVQPANALWAIVISHDEQQDSRTVALNLEPGDIAVVELIFGVPITAAEGDANTFTIRTERNAQDFRSNITDLIVRDELMVELTAPENSLISSSISDRYSYGEFVVRNAGNTDLMLNWTHGLVPDGWSIGFANPVTFVKPREEKVVRLGLIPPPQALATSNAFELLVSVLGTNEGRETEASTMITVAVLDSPFVNITAADSSIRPLQGVDRDGSGVQEFVVRNDGNVPISGDIGGVILDRQDELRNDWVIDISPSAIDSLAIGDNVTIQVTITPNEEVSKLIGSMNLNFTVGEDTIATLQIDVSVQSATGNSGLLSALPIYVSAPLGVILLLGLVVVGRRMKQSGQLQDDGLELVAPDAHTNPDHLGTRREEVLDISSAVDDLTSGEVSQEEIAQAILQSMDLPAVPASVPQGLPPGMPMAGAGGKKLPPLGLPPAGMPPVSKLLPVIPQPAPQPLPQPAPSPTPQAPVQPQGPPIPPSGLPNGWTMEQWVHYGHQWLERQG